MYIILDSQPAVKASFADVLDCVRAPSWISKKRIGLKGLEEGGNWVGKKENLPILHPPHLSF